MNLSGYIKYIGFAGAILSLIARLAWPDYISASILLYVLLPLCMLLTYPFVKELWQKTIYMVLAICLFNFSYIAHTAWEWKVTTVGATVAIIFVLLFHVAAVTITMKERSKRMRS